MAREGEFLKGCTETVVLTLLGRRRMYGYELVQEVARRSGGVFRFPQGTIYPLLYALERKGLVQGSWEAPGEAGSRRRRYYGVTAAGRRIAAANRGHWKSLVRGMTFVLGGRNASRPGPVSG